MKTLVGREIRTVSGRSNTILAVEEDDVIVATARSPGGRRVPIDSVQRAIDSLARHGEVTIDVQTLGYRSAFIGAVLATLPDAEVHRTSPPTISLGSGSPAGRSRRIDAPALRPEIFDTTMRGLESGLTVGDVTTFDFVSCSTGDFTSNVLGDPALAIFDAFPVKDGDRIVGVLERDNAPLVSSAVLSVMRRLDDSLLVSAHDPLSSLVTVLSSNPYRMVVDRARIVGIVTRSDVHKLPMRLLVFALVTHLELLMAEVVMREMPDDAWVERLRRRAARRSSESAVSCARPTWTHRGSS
jgi:hypothetical protein